MKANYTQQEVLFMTGTTFASGNLCKKDNSYGNDPLSEKEQLEEACWNGLLQSTLPEICLEPVNGGVLYVWQIKEAASSLEIRLGEIPVSIDRRYSIAPHSFLSAQSYN